ncbi:deoxyribodipyrimidine photo-lyase, partial [bacterium]|nr:deoxyribodipyrimidine photo-lyase [bacterium]
MSDKIGIHWFRLDLRLNDNPSLIHLNKEVDKIIPIYIHEENNELGQASKCWLEKSLEILDNELRTLDSKLYIFKGDPKKIINKIILDNDITSVSWN